MLSVRRATEDESSTLVKFSISIHALREERDQSRRPPAR